MVRLSRTDNGGRIGDAYGRFEPSPGSTDLYFRTGDWVIF